MKTKQERYEVRKAWDRANPNKIKEYQKKCYLKYRQKRIVDHKEWIEKK